MITYILRSSCFCEIYLKSQVFRFFSEALSIDKASEKKRNICDF